MSQTEEIEMSPITEPTTTSPKRGEARTRAILEATIELLAETGYDCMTMDAVASRARASKATIYRRWPDKSALVFEALRSRGTLVPRVADTGSLRGDLELYVRESAIAATGIAGSIVVGLLAVTARDPQLASLLAKQIHGEQLPALVALVNRARERQEVGPDIDPMIISEVLPGMLIMHILVLGLPGDEAFVHRLVDDVLLPLLTRADG